MKKDGNDDEIYEFSESKFSDALSVQNLFVNSQDFVDGTGWSRSDNGVVEVGIYYNKKSCNFEKTYLRLSHANSSGDSSKPVIFKNNGPFSNRTAIPEHGFIEGEPFIIQYQCRKTTVEGESDYDPIAGEYITSSDLTFGLER